MLKILPPQYLIIIGSLSALALALISQYFFGYNPCELCIWQRWGYVAVVVLCLLQHIPRLARDPVRVKPGPASSAGSVLRVLVSLALAAEVGIAVYHTGIEFKWWEGFQSCSSSLKSGQSIEDLRRAILSAPLTRCDEATWFFLGFSMAAWNVVYASALFLLSLLAWKPKSI